MKARTLSKTEAAAIVQIVNFRKMRGLVPVVVQDLNTNQVLMQAFMNEEALHRTLVTGVAWFYSRKKRRLWMKGEESGYVQTVAEIRLDCDRDSLLLHVL
jgi:phosphoribosyl-AMP cyclohydrolase